MLTQSKLKELLEYCPLTGAFTWSRRRRGVRFGRLAGSYSIGGVRIELGGKTYNAGRLAYLYVHGVLPDMVDHINRNPQDNRIDNLRPATYSQNNCNKGVRSDNQLGVKGVRRHRNKYLVQMKIRGKMFYKTFSTLEEASELATLLRQELHGEFAVL